MEHQNFFLLTTKNYRDGYGIYASNGFYLIMKVLEGEKLLSRKVIGEIVRYKFGLNDILYIGNLDAKRD